MACTLGAVSEREMRKHGAINVADGVIVPSLLLGAGRGGGEHLPKMLSSASPMIWGSEHEPAFQPGYGDLPLNVQPAFWESLMRVGAWASR